MIIVDYLCTHQAIVVSGSKVQVPSEIVILNSIVLPHKDIAYSEMNRIIL